MNRLGFGSLCLLSAFFVPRIASATKSAELYTGPAYTYGRFEARMRVTAGDGVVSAFFLWKDGSEKAGTFWNELDFEKIGATCQLQTNALYGNPSANHTQKPTVTADLCGGFHVYGYEWAADHIAWTLDGMEIRRETGATADAYAQNASGGMQIHFNIWPGDSSFGGNFDPNTLPVFQYIDWVQFSSYADGAFTPVWREDFDGPLDTAKWGTGNWGSPKNLSTHDPGNVNVVGGCAVLSMTSDTALGATGAMTDGCTMGMGAAGAGGTGGAAGTGGVANAGSGNGGSGVSGTGGSNASGAAGGVPGTGGTAPLAGAGGTGAVPPATGGTGAGGTNAAAGASVGGASGSTNSGGSAGAPTGNPGATGGTTSVSAGGSTTGGSAGTDAATGDGKKDGGDASSGCGVSSSRGSSHRESTAGAALALALAAVFRRRRSQRPLGPRS